LDILNYFNWQLDVNILEIRLLMSTDTGDEVVAFKNNTGKELTAL
jgi:hypothetical protein